LVKICFLDNAGDLQAVPPTRPTRMKVELERGSGNVFADLGLPNPEDRQAKARLMHVINSEIKRQGLT
jgi:helix-turn-helix protein